MHSPGRDSNDKAGFTAQLPPNIYSMFDLLVGRFAIASFAVREQDYCDRFRTNVKTLYNGGIGGKRTLSGQEGTIFLQPGCGSLGNIDAIPGSAIVDRCLYFRKAGSVVVFCRRSIPVRQKFSSSGYSQKRYIVAPQRIDYSSPPGQPAEAFTVSRSAGMEVSLGFRSEEYS